MTFLTPASRTFLYRRVSASTSLTSLFLSTATRRCKLMFSLFVDIFWLKHSSQYTSYILLWISHDLHLSEKKRMNDKPMFKPWAIWFDYIVNCLKTNIYARNIHSKSCYKTIWINEEFTLMEKNSEEKTILLFSHYSLYLINDPRVYLSSRLGLKNTPTAPLQWGKIPPAHKCHGYDTKQSDDDVPVMLGL